jgi:hypothetical protein
MRHAETEALSKGFAIDSRHAQRVRARVHPRNRPGLP